ncbi:MAG: TetR/AcrR family transcriptional regulator [Actinobacteria bacterium]|nr:TetR/AcrR family transcriptional regulator [Actinomycetota bacterium]MBI3256230.1 TetR/AcrR family transcriptional regulator [Actinomycetota bacterium]
MPKLRWGAEAPTDSDQARERLIDAAEACFERYGVMKTTVEDVAGEARVSRATVYRYFEGRDELLLGVLMREGRRFLDRLAAILASEADFGIALTEGILFTIAGIRGDDKLALLFTSDAAGTTGSVAGASEAIFALTTEFMRPFIEAAATSGQLRPGLEVDEASEWMLRTVLSFLMVQGPVERDESTLRRYLTTYFLPAVVN